VLHGEDGISVEKITAYNNVYDNLKLFDYSKINLNCTSRTL